MDAEEIVAEALESRATDLIDLSRKVRSTLAREREVVRSGEFKVEGRVVYLPPVGEVIVVGDLHGDLESLLYILKRSSFTGRHHAYMVFLGDYGDRGTKSPEVLYTLLKLKETFSMNVVLLRGNHEKPPLFPHELPYYLEDKYGSEGGRAYTELCKLFSSLHQAAIVRGKYFMVHGGPPEKVMSIRDIAYPSDETTEEMLWNDPEEVEGVYPSPRGAGKIYGKDITARTLSILGVRTLIRSHQPCDGVSVSHDGAVVTVFSRKGYPYFNRYGAYLEIDLSEDVKNGYELAEKACRF